MSTEDTINEVMNKLSSWKLFDNLSKRDIESIRQDLRNVASTAIHESQQKTQEVLADFYKKTYNGNK